MSRHQCRCCFKVRLLQDEGKRDLKCSVMPSWPWVWMNHNPEMYRWVSIKSWWMCSFLCISKYTPPRNSINAISQMLWEVCMVHLWLEFGPRQSIGTELWSSEARDFNLGLNIQQWISLRQFHTSRALHEIWIRWKRRGLWKIKAFLPNLPLQWRPDEKFSDNGKLEDFSWVCIQDVPSPRGFVWALV